MTPLSMEKDYDIINVFYRLIPTFISQINTK